MVDAVDCAICNWIQPGLYYNVISYRQIYNKYNSIKFPKSQAMRKLITKLISMLAFINIRNQQLYIVWQFIKLINIILFCIKLIRSEIMFYIAGTSAQPYLNTFYSVLAGLRTDQTIIYQIASITSVVFVGLVAVMVYYCRNDITMTDITKYSRISVFVMYYPIFTLALCQILYTPATCILINFFLHPQPSELATTMFTPILLSLFLLIISTLYNPSQRIFIYFLPLMLIFVQILNTIILSILVLIFSFIFAYREQDILNKCAYGCFFVVAVFKVIGWIDYGFNFIGAVYLLAALGLVELGIIREYVWGSFCGVSDEDNNQFLIECSKKMEQNLPNSIKQSQILRMESIFRSFYQKYYMQLKNYSKTLAFKNFKQLQYNEFMQIFDKKLQMNSDKNKNEIAYKKQLLMFRVCNNYKIYQSIKIISDFIDSQSCVLSNADLYVKKFVELVVYEEFLAKQSDNEKINQMVKMSVIQQQFVDVSLELFNQVRAFWQKINVQALIEDIIQQNFYKISKNLQTLKTLLQQLRTSYKARWQSRLLQIAMKMIYNNTNNDYNYHDNNKHSGSGNEKTAQIGEIKQNTLLFFIVRNKHIVHASPTFLKIVNFNNQELLGCQMGKIVPTDIVQDFKDQETQIIRSLKNFSIIPILCDKHYIKVFEINAKLQPKAVSGIQFFYFLRKVETDQNKAYLYVNTSDLRIQYISEQFFEIFGVQKKNVEAKMQKNQLFLNQIIINYRANELSQKIEKNKLVKCEFSMRVLKPKQKSGLHSTNNSNQAYYYKGTANLQNKFTNHHLISLSVFLADQMTVQNSKPLSKQNLFRQITSHNALRQAMKQAHNEEPVFAVSSRKIFSHKSFIKNNPQYQQDELNQQNFCLIPNPYKQKIEEKQSQLSEDDSKRIFSYTFLVTFFSIILIIFLISNALLLIFYCQQQDSNISDVIDDYGKVSGYSSALVHATYQVYEHYYIAINKDEVQKFIKQNSDSFTVETMIKTKQEHIHQILQTFQRDFTKFYNRHIFENHTYTVYHKNYEVKSNLSSTSLYQYNYNIKMANEKVRIGLQTAKVENIGLAQTWKNQIHPLMLVQKNYPVISRLQVLFDSFSDLLVVEFEEMRVFLIAIGCICGTGIVLLFLISQCMRANVQTVKRVFYIFSLIQRDVIDKKFQQLSEALQFLKTQVPKDSLKKLSDLRKIQEGHMILYHTKIRESMKMVKMDYQKIRHEDSEKVKAIFSDKNNTWCYAFQHLKIFFLIAVIFFAALGSFFLKIQLDLQQDQINNKYLAQVVKLKFDELKNSADMFYYVSIPQISNRSIILQKNVRQKKSSVDKILSGNFSNSFKQFYQQQSSLLKEDLCETEIEEPLLGELISCDNIGLGILKKGFIQASQYYDYLTQKVKIREISLLQTSPNEKYSNLFIHIYVREKLLHQLDRLRVLIDKNRIRLQVKYKQNVIWFGLGFSIIGIALAAYIVLSFIPRVNKIRKIGIGYFKILPKQTLQKIYISAYIKENRLLDRVTML